MPDFKNLDGVIRIGKQKTPLMALLSNHLRFAKQVDDIQKRIDVLLEGIRVKGIVDIDENQRLVSFERQLSKLQKDHRINQDKIRCDISDSVQKSAIPLIIGQYLVSFKGEELKVEINQ